MDFKCKVRNVIIFVYFITLSTLCIDVCANDFDIDTICYAKRNGIELKMEIISPCGANDKTSAIIFFFGGSWINGNRSQFRHQAENLAQMGMIAILADYRTKSLCNATPFECVEDAKSAIRFIKKNSVRLKIDSTRIVASGGSAGGHLAAACAYISEYNNSEDDLSISPRPAALALFNPVIDNSERGFGTQEVKNEYLLFSPLHNIKNGNALPTLFMVGSKDNLIPLETAKEFKYQTEKNGASCILKVYDGQEHGFFNYNFKNKGNKYYNKTLDDLKEFIVMLGF